MAETAMTVRGFGRGDYLKPFEFKRHSQHVANGIIVIYQQDLMRNGSIRFGVIQHCPSSRIKTAIDDRVTQTYFSELYNIEQVLKALTDNVSEAVSSTRS